MADALTGVAQMTEMVLEIIEEKAMESAARMKVWRPAILQEGLNLLNRSGQGTPINIAQRGTVTLGLLTENTQPDSVQYDLAGERTLTPVKIGADWCVSWEAVEYPIANAKQQIIDESAIALSLLEDTDATYGFAGLYTEASGGNILGATTAALDAAYIAAGVQRLIVQGAPGQKHLFTDAIGWGHLMTDETAMNFIRSSADKIPGEAVTNGIDGSRYIGKIHNCHVWCTDGTVSASSALHHIMTVPRAVALAYKNFSSPLSPTPSAVNIDVEWHKRKRGWEISLTTVFDIGGQKGTASNNNPWLVDIKTKTT